MKAEGYDFMKYFYEKPETWDREGWKVYSCDHPMYNRCTLYLDDDGKGLAVVQKHYNEQSKSSWWGSLDPWLASDIYHHNNFWKYFEEHSMEKDPNGLYPTVTARTIMWALRMKPLLRQYWEEKMWS
jgi:hypothetical protein